MAWNLPCQKHSEIFVKEELARQAVEYCIYPPEEVMGLRQQRVCFLVTDDNSQGTVVAFEVTVAGGARLMARKLQRRFD